MRNIINLSIGHLTRLGIRALSPNQGRQAIQPVFIVPAIDWTLEPSSKQHRAIRTLASIFFALGAAIVLSALGVSLLQS